MATEPGLARVGEAGADGDPAQAAGRGRPGRFRTYARGPEITALIMICGVGYLLLRAAWADSLTNDEGIYLHSGICAFSAGVVDLEDTNPAGFKLMAGLGALLSGVQTDTGCDSFAYQTLLRPFDLEALRRLVFFGRLPVIAVSLLLVAGCGWWAHKLSGWTGALTAIGLVGFNPVLVAHGHLMTGDVPLTAGLTGSLAALWAWRRTGRRRWSVVSGLAFGFALLNKASAVTVLPALVLIVVLTGCGSLSRRAHELVVVGVRFAAVCAATVVLAYLPFESRAPFPIDLPVVVDRLVPTSWIYGFHWQLGHAAQSQGALTYLNGEIQPSGSWVYFPEGALLKSSLGYLVALGTGGVALFARRATFSLWTVLPGALLFASAMAAGINIGIRYVLPSLVLFGVAAAVGIGVLPWPRWRVAVGALVAGSSVVAVLLGPVGSIGYFNALATRPHTFYLADSNIDFGQDGWRLRRWWLASGQVPLQADYFGYLPASYYVPGTIDVGGHGERLDDADVEPVEGRVLVVSATSASGDAELVRYLRDPPCRIGSGLVVVGADRCGSVGDR